MQEAFNDHMKKCFSAAWAVCLDESMVKWLNEFSPGWMAVGRKPSPFGNEYHTMACAVLHVIFWIEIVEGKDRPPQLGPLLHVEAHGKLCGLVLRAAESIKGSNRVIGMDSGFGVLATLPELRKRGLHGTVVLKKKKFWAKGLPGDDILEALRMADVGTTKVLVGKYKGEKIWIGCQVDSKHTTLIGNTWSTTERNGKKKERLAGGSWSSITANIKTRGIGSAMRWTMQITIERTLFRLKTPSTPKIGPCGSLHSLMRCVSATPNRPTTIGFARSKTNL
jgi:hypothetical protein